MNEFDNLRSLFKKIVSRRVEFLHSGYFGGHITFVPNVTQYFTAMYRICAKNFKSYWQDDAWIVVHGKVYDITEHILNHPGWDSAAISTVLSILAHIGMDCTEEFVDIHRPYPIAWNQLKAYYIGELVESNQQELQHSNPPHPKNENKEH